MSYPFAFHGEISCAVDGCQRRAYYEVRKKGYYCGSHSRKLIRIDMKKRTKTDLDRIQQAKMLEELKIIEDMEQKNGAAGMKGEVVLDRLRGPFGKPQDILGFHKIFPNFKHQNRLDGFGCKSLSPKAMGPILHCQPGLPRAENLENLHQSNKVFESEADSEGNPLPIFYKTRLEMYQDPIPHRHKEAAKGKNQCKYSIWVLPDGTEQRLSYVESRQIYCHYYEEFAKKDDNFKKLKAWHEAGRNLQIVGYDAFPMDIKHIEQAYLDPTHPFGHERVLMTMIVIPESKNFPWNKHRTLEFL